MAEINTWPGWECVRQIGAGSFGKVYEIHRRENGRNYRAALKVITIPTSESEINSAFSEGMDERSITAYFQEMVDRMMDEFTMMAEFKGTSNIVSYEDHMLIKHEIGIGWTILIRMELLMPLSEYMMRRPPEVSDVIKMGCDLCRALELCQRKNIIHRDIKPENIFVNEYGDYKLGDFGIARTAERTMSNLSQKGTYTYIAPEVYMGRPYGRRADIYSLGMVLYRYLNENRLPFMPHDVIRYSDREEAFRRRMSGEQISPPLNGSQALKWVILKALSFNQEERFCDAGEFRTALLSCVGHEPGAQSDPTWRMPYDVDKTEAVMPGSQLVGNYQQRGKPDGRKKKKMVLIGGLAGTAAVLLVVGGMRLLVKEGMRRSSTLQTEEEAQEATAVSVEQTALQEKVSGEQAEPEVEEGFASVETKEVAEEEDETNAEEETSTAPVVKKKSRYEKNRSTGEMYLGYCIENDSNGKQLSWTSYDSEGKILNVSTYEYEYDEGERPIMMIERETSKVTGEKISWTKYEYDKADRQERIIYGEGERFDEDKILRIRKNEYDSAGNLVRVISSEPDEIAGAFNNISSWMEYKYDENGIMIGESSIVEGKTEWGIEYKLDDAGNCVKETYFREGQATSWAEYKYDMDGNCVKETDYDGEGQVTAVVEYEYDAHGNKTAEIVYGWFGYDWGVTEYYWKYEYDAKDRITREYDITDVEQYTDYEYYD